MAAGAVGTGRCLCAEAEAGQLAGSSVGQLQRWPAVLGQWAGEEGGVQIEVLRVLYLWAVGCGVR